MAQTLTDTERAVLVAASWRDDGRIHPLPEGVDADLLIGTLVAKGLVEQGLEERPGQIAQVPFYRISDKALEVLQPDPDRSRRASNGTQGPTPVDAFIDGKTEFDSLLDELKSRSDDHFNVGADNVKWADVETINKHLAILRPLADTIRKEGKFVD